MKRLAVFILIFFLCRESLAQHDTLVVSTSVTTHVMFAEELVYVDIPSRVVTAKIVDGNRRLLALRAKETFGDIATVSTLENDGNLRTFILRFEMYPEELIYRFDGLDASEVDASGIPPAESADLSGFRRRLYHIADCEYGISVQCLDISTADDRTTVVLSLENRSVVSYRTSSPRFVIEGRKTTRKRTHVEKAVWPVSCTSPKISISPGGKIMAAYSFENLTLPKDHILKVYFYEDSGTRNFILNICARDVNEMVNSRSRKGAL